MGSLEVLAPHTHTLTATECRVCSIGGNPFLPAPLIHLGAKLLRAFRRLARESARRKVLPGTEQEKLIS